MGYYGYLPQDPHQGQPEPDTIAPGLYLHPGYGASNRYQGSTWKGNELESTGNLTCVFVVL